MPQTKANQEGPIASRYEAQPDLCGNSTIATPQGIDTTTRPSVIITELLGLVPLVVCPTIVPRGIFVRFQVHWGLVGLGSPRGAEGTSLVCMLISKRANVRQLFLELVDCRATRTSGTRGTLREEKTMLKEGVHFSELKRAEP